MLGLDISFLSWDVINKFVLGGLRFSLLLTIVATVGGVVFGTILALMRLSGNKALGGVAAFYVNGMRSIPLVMVILWFYLLVPLLIGKPIGAELSASITFIAFEAAYFSEIMRAGIQSIPRGQVQAGYAMGLNYRQVMAHVVLPQAFRNMAPVLLTQTIVLFQDVSMVYVLSITDFVGAATKVAQRDGRLVEMYLFVALVYFLLCFGLSRLVRRVQARTAIVR